MRVIINNKTADLNKIYFGGVDEERAYPLQYFVEEALLEDKYTFKVFEAVPENINEYIYCKYFNEVGEKQYCGKECEGYTQPRGKCRHRGRLYTWGNEVEVEVLRRTIKTIDI